MLEIVPHNATSFTQGLEMFNGNMLESSGLYGKSRLSEVDIVTGRSLGRLFSMNLYFQRALQGRFSNYANLERTDRI